MVAVPHLDRRSRWKLGVGILLVASENVSNTRRGQFLDTGRAMQRSLFDEIDLEPEPKLARDGDPETSHAAADEIAPKLGKVQLEVLSVFRRSMSSLTANEAAEVARRSTRDNAKMCETYRKRCGELERKGLLRCVGKRTCNITGKQVQHYVAAD